MGDFYKNRIYLDNNATTKPSPAALKGLEKAIKCWGNPSSIHQRGAAAKTLLWSSREAVGRLLNCSPLELIFSSGATESNNQALKGLFSQAKKDRNELIISAVEHPSILEPADFLARRGFKVHTVPVSKEGFLDMNFFEKHLSEKTLLTSIMYANNETGILFPIKELAKKANEKGSLFHSDMVQALGKVPIDLQDLNVDFAGFSAHKYYGLKGCGALYCKKGTELSRLIHGGPQERRRRAGTENLPGIAAFGAAAEEGADVLKANEKLKPLRDEMEKNILSSISNVTVIGAKAPRLGNTSCLHIAGVEGETLLMNLDLKGISVSVGSACGSGKLEPRAVLTAMGWTEQEAKSALRISLGAANTKEELEYFQKTLKKCIQRLRGLDG